MSKLEIHPLFATPVYISEINRNFSIKEISFINKEKLNYVKNEGNITSKNNYILNEKPFLNLKKELDLIVADYFNKILFTKNVTPYITQSWINFTETNQFHHKHSHPNSIVSGVLYINADEKNDKIRFFKDAPEIIKMEHTEWNLFNSFSWWFPVKTGNIILFPSSLTHCVDIKQGTNTRVSLAFNTFVKGILGDNSNLNELKL